MPPIASRCLKATIAAMVVGLTSVAVGQVVSLPGFGQPGAQKTPVTATAEFSPATGNQPAMLTVTATVDKPWHIYSVTQGPGGPVRTKITLDPSATAKLAGDFQVEQPPHSHNEPVFGNIIVETHEGNVTWRAPIDLPAGVDPSQLTIAGKLFVQACTDQNCLPPANVPFTAKYVAATPAAVIATPTTVVSTPVATPSSVIAAETTTSKPSVSVGTYTHSASHAIIEGRIEPQVVEPGGKATLHLKAIPTDGFHVYALASKAPPLGSRPTLIKLTSSTPCPPQAPKASSIPQEKQDTDKSTIRYHKEPVEWTLDLCIPADAKPGAHTVEGLIGYMTCLADGQCDLPRAARFTGIVNIGGERKDGSMALAFADAKYAQVEAIAAAEPGPTMQATTGITPAMGLSPDHDMPHDMTALPTMLFFALLGGLILNLMPCVLPVIGLKIFSFIEQAGESRRVALLLNLWYTAGVLAVFMGLATLASAAQLGLADTSWGWGQQNSSVAFNIIMCSIVFVMSLSFMGVWEIPIPGFVGSGKAQDLAAREGAIGAFSKGAITTILATPCSGPYLGTVFGYTLTQPPAVTYLLFGFIGLGMASPYLLLGAFPSLIRFLPKPGAWMETFKQAMGFVMLGAIVFLFSAMPKREYVVPTFCLLIGLWAGCWWIGRTPLYAGRSKLIKAYVVGALIAVVVGVAGFKVLLPGESLIAWRPFSQSELAKLTSEGKTVMVDFTADWCLTCKTNLNFVFNTPEVSDAIQRAGVVPLLVDLTDPDSEDWKVLNSLGYQSIPMLAIFPAGKPQKPIPLPDLLTKREVLKALEQAGPSRDSQSASRQMLSAER